jgi:hypothetical protein
MTPKKLYPALLGGTVIGVLSALPVVSLGNVCCCLWMVSGGMLAAWLMQQNHTLPVAPLDGAVVGFLAGIVGAFAYLVVAWPVTLLLGPMMDEWLRRAVDSAGDTPLRDLVEQYRGPGTHALSVVLGFFLQLFLGMVFATIGGVLGAMLFKKTPPLPPPPLTQPSAPWVPPPAAPPEPPASTELPPGPNPQG